MFAQCIAVGVVLGMHAFSFSADSQHFWSMTAHVFVWLTLLTSVGSALAYMTRTRRYLLETSG
jgi:hypothetical protein